MDNALASITAGLEDAVGPLLGTAGPRPILGQVTTLDLSAAVCFLLVTLLGILVITLVSRGRTATAVGPVSRFVAPALRLPLCSFVGACGLYAATVPLLQRAPASRGLEFAHALLDTLLTIGLITAIAWFLIRISRSLERRAVARSKGTSRLGALFIPLLATSAQLVIAVAALGVTISLIDIPEKYELLLQRLTSVALIVAIGIFFARAVGMGRDALLAHFAATSGDTVRARKASTQIHFITRALYAVIGLFAFAAILMMFQQVRHIGISLLTSAGIIGIVAGIAAQQPLSNLFAGFQIALTQPMREDDVVVVEGECGRIEELTLSYVVVHIWDDRRLILPLSYFLQKPFQNWTRSSTAMLGSVLLWVDYNFSVEEGRKVLKKIIENHPLWDKRFWNLQVSDANERTMQLRVLATASDSSQSWDLRCDIRERFIAFIRASHPESLPRVRTEIIGQSTTPGSLVDAH